MKIVFPQCHSTVDKPTGAVNRARKIGAPVYCGKHCAGLGRRTHKPKAQKVAEKRVYDMQYRAKNLASIKVKKHAHFKRTYDPATAAVERKKRMPKHVEYCRQPRYKEWKREYDRQYQSKKYGAFAEAFLLSVNLNREIKSRTTNYEIRRQNETGNKRQSRARQAVQGCDRHSRAQS